MTHNEKTAVVVWNLGGPDNLDAVRPFLQNLFADPNIINLPAIFRLPLAWLIAKTRTPKVIPTYGAMGGRSPILPNTEAQAEALEKVLGENFKVFVNMRYWHPMTNDVVKNVKAYNPDHIILLPLYPQFSTTTTGSSLRVWDIVARKHKLKKPTQLICCYPTTPGFVEAQASLVQQAYNQAAKEHKTPPRVLFSAHGLPQKIVDNKKDPYPDQVRTSAAEIVKRLNIKDLDWLVTFQSRVGPLEWVKPYTDKEIERAGNEKTPLVIVPHSFVSEHLETLEELDQQFFELAQEAGVPGYYRVPTVSTHPDFIAQLADLVRTTITNGGKIEPGSGPACGNNCPACPYQLTK